MSDKSDKQKPQVNLNYLIAGAYVALIFLTIIYVTMILPASTFQPEASVAAHAMPGDQPPPWVIPYTPAELHGRFVYDREGCWYCHTQFNRYQDRENGEMVAAGDYAYETPHLLGTERTGPDLSNIGGKYPDEWHWAHHMNPRKMKPGSIMPSFSYLSHEDMSDLIAYLQTIGRERNQARFDEWVKQACDKENTGNDQGYEECLAKYCKLYTTGADQNYANCKAREDGTLPKGVHEITWIEPPQEMRDVYNRVAEKIDVNNAAIANSGRGIFMENCAVCHGVMGQGNGPISQSMAKKPANFTRPFFKEYSDAMWFYRISEGVAGTRMPRWGKTLSDQDIMYLIAFLKTLPHDGTEPANDIETVKFSQLDNPKAMDTNYQQITKLDNLHDDYMEGKIQPKTPLYGGGRD